MQTYRLRREERRSLERRSEQCLAFGVPGKKCKDGVLEYTLYTLFLSFRSCFLFFVRSIGVASFSSVAFASSVGLGVEITMASKAVCRFLLLLDFDFVLL